MDGARLKTNLNTSSQRFFRLGFFRLDHAARLDRAAQFGVGLLCWGVLLCLALGLGSRAVADGLMGESDAHVLSGTTEAELADPWVTHRQLYRQALESLEQGQTARLAEIQARLRDYPLYPYLEYELLRKQLNLADGPRIQAFLERYPDLPLSSRLGREWARFLARGEHWREFLAFYDVNPDNTELYCHYLWARHQTGQRSEVLSAVPELWLTGHSLPRSCDPLLAAWRSQGGATPELVGQRIELALEAGNGRLAYYLARYLPDDERAWIQAHRRIHQQPEQLRRMRPQTSLERWVLLHGLRRLIREDVEVAAALWRERPDAWAFSAEERAHISRPLALRLAVRFHPQARYWLQQALLDQDDPVLHEWLVRQALRTGDWPQVVADIDAMPKTLAQESRWQYWLARSLEQQGGQDQLERAQTIYQQLARERDYHGFLAADRLGLPYRFNHRPWPVDRELVDQLAKWPAMERARELYRLGMLQEARREWHEALHDAPAEEILAAASLARQWGWLDQALQGAIAAQAWDDLETRFPMLYEEIFTRYAQDQRLDLNWVLALVRQESAFISDARSPRGASGLMQLMPETARLTAKKLGQRLRDETRLLNPAVNIELGTAHLRELLSRFGDNPILATAAYNAGSKRVWDWLEIIGDSLSQDVWIELLPYRETRHYVQNVLTYSVIYAHRRGEDARLPPARDIACSCTR